MILENAAQAANDIPCDKTSPTSVIETTQRTAEHLPTECRRRLQGAAHFPQLKSHQNALWPILATNCEGSLNVLVAASEFLLVLDEIPDERFENSHANHESLWQGGRKECCADMFKADFRNIERKQACCVRILSQTDLAIASARSSTT